MENVHVCILMVLIIVVTLYVLSCIHTSKVIEYPPIIGGHTIKIQISGNVNPSISIPFKIGKYESVFILDTGYAGAPVLNTKILDIPFDGNIDMYLSKLSNVACSNEDANRKLDGFKTHNKCIDYTSGCVLRLMGIGETSEKASDMLLCSPILMKTENESSYVNVKQKLGIAEADVLMTNHELNSPHILTLDYLMHLSPCMICPRQGKMHLGMGSLEFVSERAQCEHVSSETIGGAYVCTLNVDGVPVRCTVDTGASMTICIGKSVFDKMSRYKKTDEHIQQIGINSEVICSNIILSDISFCGKSFSEVPVFVNDQEVEETDGYVGLGLLKCFDLLVTPIALFAKYNGGVISSLESYTNVRHSGDC